jgi:hypothetical protein
MNKAETLRRIRATLERVERERAELLDCAQSSNAWPCVHAERLTTAAARLRATLPGRRAKRARLLDALAVLRDRESYARDVGDGPSAQGLAAAAATVEHHADLSANGWRWNRLAARRGW